MPSARRMPAAGLWCALAAKSTYQRSTLTANHGTYFLDTSVSYERQWTEEAFTKTVPCKTPRHPRRLLSAQRERVPGRQDLQHVLPLCEARDQADVSDLCRPRLQPRYRSQDHRANLDRSRCRGSIPPIWPATWTKHYNDTTACSNFKPYGPCGILQVTIDFKEQTDLDPKSQCTPHLLQVRFGRLRLRLTANDPLAQAGPARNDRRAQKIGGIQGACQKS